jgi:hypothetical protein
MKVRRTYPSTDPKSRTWVTSLDSWIDRKSTSPGKDNGRHRYPDSQPDTDDVTDRPDLLLGIDKRVMDEVGIDVYHFVNLDSVLERLSFLFKKAE